MAIQFSSAFKCSDSFRNGKYWLSIAKLQVKSGLLKMNALAMECEGAVHLYIKFVGD